MPIQLIRFVLVPCLLMVAGVYLYVYLKRTAAFWKLNVQNKAVKILLALSAAGLAISAMNIWAIPALVVLYLTVSCLCMELIQGLVRLFTQKPPVVWSHLYRCGLVPVAAMLLILGLGYVNMHHIVETSYTLTTDKIAGSYRVALLTDLHFGTSMNTVKLQEICDRIDARSPDIVILGGDIVDEHTTLTEMQDCMRILGSMDSPYGVFYIMGNHDKSRYTDKPHYSKPQLLEAIETGGITLLADRVQNIGPDLTLIGRDDAAYALNGDTRKSSAELLEQVDAGRFMLLLDHQPLDVEENSRLGYDLQLSGHTHGGQIWPVGLINLFSGLNYGHDQIGDFDVIVSSGLAGWGYPIKTQGKAEYVLIDLQGT